MEKHPCKESVQVVAIDSAEDLDYAKGKNQPVGFYKFPKKGVPYPKKECKYVAFYLTNNEDFGNDKKGVVYFTEIRKYNKMLRENICKDFLNSNHPNNKKLYYKLELSLPLKELDHKIENKYSQRVAYRYTSLNRLKASRDVSQLKLNLNKGVQK